MNKAIVVISLLFVSSLCYSQKDFTEVDYHTQTINHSDYSERIEFVNDEKEIKTSVDLSYHWIKNQNVLVTQGGYSGKLLHGKYEAFYHNKSLKEKGSFEYGLKNGEWIYWRENGTLKKRESWRKGKLNDQAIIYSHIGNDSLLIPYKNGKIHGKVYEVFGDQQKHIQTYKHGLIKKDKEEKVIKWWNKKNKDYPETEKLTKEEKKTQKKEALIQKKAEKESNLDESEEGVGEKKGMFSFLKKDKDKKKEKEEKPGLFKRLFNKDEKTKEG